MISMRDSVEACRLSMKVQLDNIAAYGLMYFHFAWVYSFADVPALVLDSLWTLFLLKIKLPEYNFHFPLHPMMCLRKFIGLE